MTRQTSLLASRVGAARADGGRRQVSVDPAHTGAVVAEVLLAEPATFVAACRAARAAQPGWAATPAPVRGRVVKHLGRLVEENFEALARLGWHAGLPDGVLDLVQADGPATFEGLEAALAAGLVDKVGFTGSTEVGRRIGELCGRHLQVPCLELGGKNPLVVMPDADLDLAVEGALFSGFGTAGQRCTSLGTVIVHQSVHDEFISKFAEAVEEAPVGDPSEDVLYGPMIHERFFERFLGWLELIEPHHSVHGSSGM